jgi:hypothetical protein
MICTAVGDAAPVIIERCSCAYTGTNRDDDIVVATATAIIRMTIKLVITEQLINAD